VSPTNAATDNSGLARAQWTLGLTLDTAKYRVTAVVVGVATDVVFTATPQLPTSLILEVLGDSQYGIAGERLVESVGLRVGVQLSGGWFPIRNVVVSFAVTEGNGTITPPQLRTNDYGEARASWVLGPEEGTNRGTIAVATRTVALTAVAVQPSFVVYNDSQVAFAGTGLAESLLVLLQVPTRWGGNVGVPGQAVSFAVTSGAGVITPSQVTTDGGGWARASWVLGTAPGSNTATATFRSVAVSLTAEGFQPIAVNAIATGSAHSCAVTVTGTTYCWGDNRTGQLGDGGITRQPRPVAVVGGPALVAIAAGSQHTCGVDAGGLVYCWGDNTAGQLGDGTLISRLVPTAVSGGPPLVSLTLGRLHSCGLTSAGSAYCWGDNTFGQVGDSSTTARLGPTAVAGGRVFTRLSAGDDHTCGLEPGGGIYCWGVNNLGQLGATTSERCTYRTPGGIGSATCSTAPARVSTALSFTDLTSRNAHACGLTSGGAVYCWGQGDVGLEFVQSDAPPFSRLANGTTCALTAAGDAYCWDVYLDEYYGYRYITWPSRVGGAVGFSLVVGREGHSCAQSAGVQAYAYCWGYNADGQLGDGTVRSRYVPGPVWLVGP
jgi:alpha-tubulin suppressor-like RCC1 family protein